MINQNTINTLSDYLALDFNNIQELNKHIYLKIEYDLANQIIDNIKSYKKLTIELNDYLKHIFEIYIEKEKKQKYQNHLSLFLKNNYTFFFGKTSLSMIICETPVPILKAFLKKNKDIAIFLLTSIDYESYSNFDFYNVYSNILKNCEDNSIPINFNIINPLGFLSFQYGLGSLFLKKIKKENLVELFYIRNSEKRALNYGAHKDESCLPFRVAIHWLHKMFSSTLFFYKKDSLFYRNEIFVAMDFYLKNKETNETIYSYNKIEEGFDLYCAFSFFQEKRFNKKQIEVIERLNYIISLLRENNIQIETFIHKNNKALVLDNDKFENILSQIDRKLKVYFQFKNKINSFFINKRKNKHSILLKKEIHRTIADKLKIEFDYVKAFHEEDSLKNVLSQIEAFLEEYPEYYDKKNRYIKKEGIELFLLNHLC